MNSLASLCEITYLMMMQGMLHSQQKYDMVERTAHVHTHTYMHSDSRIMQYTIRVNNVTAGLISPQDSV